MAFRQCEILTRSTHNFNKNENTFALVCERAIQRLTNLPLPPTNLLPRPAQNCNKQLYQFQHIPIIPIFLVRNKYQVNVSQPHELIINNGTIPLTEFAFINVTALTSRLSSTIWTMSI